MVGEDRLAPNGPAEENEMKRSLDIAAIVLASLLLVGYVFRTTGPRAQLSGNSNGS